MPSGWGYPGFTTAEAPDALKNLTTGIGNTAVGWRSLFTTDTHILNTAVGAGTLVLNNSDENTAVGAGPLLSTTQFGLIAEEVVKVHPDLVLDKDGNPFTMALRPGERDVAQ